MGKFVKGKSGNPSGRPKIIAEIQTLARAHTEDALKALVEITNSGESDAARVAAANSLLDRGYGKAPATLAGENGEGNAGLEVTFRWMAAESNGEK